MASKEVTGNSRRSDLSSVLDCTNARYVIHSVGRHLLPHHLTERQKMAIVSIACKLPHGLFAQLYKMIDVPSGVAGQFISTAHADGDRVKLNGANHDNAIAGWGITDNIDKSWADAWMAQNATLQPVKIGLIFVRESTEKIAPVAKAKKEMVTGFESLNPDKMPDGLQRVEKD